eukprot:11191145-Lingulodinium_polyedra.AAC.1
MATIVGYAWDYKGEVSAGRALPGAPSEGLQPRDETISHPCGSASLRRLAGVIILAQTLALPLSPHG